MSTHRRGLGDRVLWFARSRFLSFVQGRLRDKELYHGECRGTDAGWVLLGKNLLSPSRFLTKVTYGQVMRMPSWWLRATPLPDVDRSPEVLETVARLRADGVAILPGRFASEAAEISATRDLAPSSYSPSSDYRVRYVRPMDATTYRILTDRWILSVVGLYYGYQPYVRDFPNTSVGYPEEVPPHEAAERTTGFADNWHYDTTNQVTAHVLLSDVDPKGTRMLVAVGTHRIHHQRLSTHDQYLSDKYVLKQYRRMGCSGPRGTLILFDSNSLHRMEPVSGSFRAHLHINYTPGNDLVRGPRNTAKFGEPPDLGGSPLYVQSQLSTLQRNALASLLGEGRPG